MHTIIIYDTIQENQVGVQLNSISSEKKVGKLSKILTKLGRLPDDFDEKPLLEVLEHKNEKVRVLVIKNLAKLSDITYLDLFKNIVNEDESSSVRREAVSAIGRLRHPDAKEILFAFLNDNDPEIVLQSIRGLLVFKQERDVTNNLKKLINHPNEIIQEVIHKEFKSDKNNSVVDHVKSPDFMKNVVVKGDVIETLKLIPDESIHLTFTSPPYYNARDYSIYRSYKEYLLFLENVFREVHRVTKEGRFFILNTSPVIIPRVGRQYSSRRYPIPYDIHPILVKMGWEFIDDIVWVKPEASAKNRNAGFLQHRKPLGYKPNACSECVMVYRKKTDKLIDWNMKQYSKEIIDVSRVDGDYETSNLWEIDPTYDKTHSAVFPLELCNRVIKFYSFVGDLVFDPFAGSGTFGKSAINLNRFFFLTEQQSKYIERIKEHVNQGQLFGENKFTPRFLNIKDFCKEIENGID